MSVLKVLCICDSHGSHSFPLDVEADVVCTLGDLSGAELLSVKEHYKVPILSVYGNSDTLSSYEAAGVTLLDGKSVEINGVKFGGISGIPVYSPRQPFYVKEEHAVEEMLQRMGRVDIMLSHSNPMIPFCDDESNGYRGFQSFVNYMNLFRPKQWWHGHLHNPNTYKHKDTTVTCVYGHFLFEI